MNRVILVLIFLCHIQVDAKTFSDTVHRYFWANYETFNKKYDTADKWFDDLQNNSLSIYTFKGYIHHLFEKESYDTLITAVQNAPTDQAKEATVQKLYGIALTTANQIEKADTVFITLAQKATSDPEIAFYAVQAYQRRKEPQNALLTIDNYLDGKSKNFNDYLFYFLKAQIYISMGENEHAKTAAQKALAIHPHFDRAWLLLSVIYEEENNIPEAIAGYTAFLKTTTTQNIEIQKHIIDLAVKQKLPNKKTNSTSTDCFQKSLIFMQKKEYEKSLEQIEFCLAQTPENADHNIIKIELLSQLRRPADAVTHLVHLVQRNPTNNQWMSILHGYALRTGFLKEAHQTFDAHKTRDAHLYASDLALRMHRWDNAKTHLVALQSNELPKELSIQINHYIASIDYISQDFGHMESTLNTILAQNPDHIPSLNLLAYYYATKGKNIDRARNLITQARVLDANNPHLLDTHATVLYKEGKHHDALQLLRQAYVSQPQDASILIHLAKVHKKIGRDGSFFAQEAHTHAQLDHEKKSAQKLISFYQPRQHQ